jgi:hypothetical protein
LDLAISTLGIEGAGSERERRPGPRDTARLAELEELDKQIVDPTRYQGARYQLVEDCPRSAILARGLERPRNEVGARFAQADHLAQQLGIRQQRMRIAYNRAWTAYWWYEDYTTFGQFYDEVEQHLEGSTQATEVERLLTLWQLLLPSVAAGRISEQDAKVEPRRERLAAMLQAIADDPARPNNTLQARTGLVLMKISQSLILASLPVGNDGKTVPKRRYTSAAISSEHLAAAGSERIRRLWRHFASSASPEATRVIRAHNDLW